MLVKGRLPHDGALAQRMAQMLVLPEEQMNGLSIEAFFGDTFAELKENPTW